MKYPAMLCLILASVSAAQAASENEHVSTNNSTSDNDYVFDKDLFRGGRFSEELLGRLTRPNSILAGQYKMDIYINSQFSEQYNIDFIEQPDGSVKPCLTPEMLTAIGLKNVENAEGTCKLIEQVAKGSSTYVDASRFRLEFTIPQMLLNKVPRGYVNPRELDTGSSLGFANYIANYYHVSYSDNEMRDRDSVWASLNGGLNLGSWQYRQLSNINWDKEGGSKWNNIRSYVQRPLPLIQSQLMMGELITNGRFFSGLDYNGVSLSSDERMLPDSMRGYAPTIRGVATSNAKVSVTQNGTEIYQTTVVPGAFEINDLYPTSYSGDLIVTITEADGSVSHFSVPFSAVPESMRPGISRYSVEIGKTRDSGEEAPFSDLIWQRGITNSITSNMGLRISDGYQSALIGGVYGSYLGSFGVDATYSRADLPDEGYTEGWMAHLAWSKTFQPTSTTVSLAGYRYSTDGYRDFSDVLGLREAWKRGEADDWQSSTYRQLARFDVSVSQSLQSYGNIFLTGSAQSYRGDRNKDMQLQFGYSNTFAYGIAMNLSVGRQRTGSYNDDEGSMQTMTSLSFSIPFGSGPRAADLTNSWTHSSDGGDQYQTAVSGMVDEAMTTNYNLNVTRDQENKQTTVGGNLQKRTTFATLGVNASQGQGYWQASGNAQGAFVAHSGGLTMGPYLGDTFALVEAKGATGAKIYSSQQVVIDSNGYALVPAVTPYRYNRISLDPQGMEGDAELVDSEKQIAPVAGAGVKVVFRTRTGTALLIRTRFKDGQPVPLGADVLDEKGDIVGMAGQGGQIYVRAEKTEGELVVRWGDDAEDKCRMPYKFPAAKQGNALLKLDAVCVN
ncbi:fimbria/pilus outer membrane usher protein [Leclercia sp.]|uniref:fimbria/pilus outer membrane usher protein n=1 Tax=Leclercia sp. TaxID=1898428 RepID=UPI00289A169B|nr:fimbria/pilus outer membrane usher protein [Leclercia sp.]